jgi:hypothetical protein
LHVHVQGWSGLFSATEGDVEEVKRQNRKELELF